MKHLKKLNNHFNGLQAFLALWSSQGLSALGSSMTSYALIIWSYQQKGSALSTALLSVCSYAPYVIFSVFAGVLSDRWKKKYTMLICDSLAALSTCAVWFLLLNGSLEVWHLCIINAINGLMNSLQQPASEVAVSLLAPKEQFQKVGGMRSFSNSLVTILTPMIAMAVLSLAGIQAVLLLDLGSFIVAFITLAVFIKIPEEKVEHSSKQNTFLSSAKEGIEFLRANRGILDLILFLAAVNLISSIYEAALPAMLLSRNGGSETALGMVTVSSGIANVAGSILVTLMPVPKSRVRVICNTLLLSMCTENFFLAFGRSLPVWCTGAILGWFVIPMMNTNLDTLLRLHIPINMQGRVYSVRNTLQFFTIPLGYLTGGLLVDKLFEPIMSNQSQGGIMDTLFGLGKGSGAAVLFAILAFAGVFVCLYFRRKKSIWSLERND